MRPLHHGDGTAEPGNWLESINDSPAGVLTADILHSVGALLFAGGIACYLYVAHSMRRAVREGRPAQMGLLSYAHAFTLSGVVLNAVGGLMRLYQTDHPGIDRLGDSTWVQVLLVKHLFLIVGVGLALWLAWRTRRLRSAAEPEPQWESEGPRMAWFAAASLSTILLAAVLGAAAGNVDLAADLGTSDPLAGPPMDEHAAHDVPVSLAEFSTGNRITGTPAQPGTQDHTMTVPLGADRVTATLTWSTPQASQLSPVELDLELRNPSGETVAGETTRVEQSLTRVVVGEAVRPGTWTLRVVASRALEESYTLRADVVRSGGLGNVLDRTITLDDGAFFEANLLMSSGRTIAIDWSVQNSTSRRVDFNVHVHVGESVEYPVQGDYNSFQGNYTHDGRSPGPSLMWENRGNDPVRIRFRVTGEFALHSYSG